MFERQFGNFYIAVERAFDSAVLERFILPALIYQTTTHWGERAIGQAQMGHSIVFSFWCWSLRIKYITYDYR